MKRSLTLPIVVLVMLAAATALAQTLTATTATVAPGDIRTPEDALNVGWLIIQVFKGGGWTVGAGLCLSFGIAAARFFKLFDKIPDKYDGWVAVIVAVLGSVAGGLQLKQDWVTIVFTAVSVGVTAIGSWELVLKKVRDVLLKRNRVTAEKAK